MKMKGPVIATVEITDLKIQTCIGTNDWERTKKQDVVINIMLTYDANRAVASDNLKDALDYKALKKRIIAFVKNSRYRLLERLTHEVLNLILKDARVTTAQVRIEKPQALCYAKSVSICMASAKSR